ncbi:hypothetical protein BK133_13510 [Paenibacillus sp. FSL H8-0548]|uniref:hypothetical protein n=1 Tax=Paenibacillus sp. FSL H8-0548 TaxID=1920422 RepID=UPI00096D1B6D|nr:hypothetical protein [Paenibacillus sp. FSL H8-0548]OMF33803.1 hypothetical protein BK133_13510 [Paenibacillus sp. FSL H8-0548]
MIFKKFAAVLLACCSILLITQVAAAHPAHNSPTTEVGLKPVQVFDVAAGKVVKTIPNDAQFQTLAASWVGSITGLAPQVTNDESCSYVYRVPLEKAVTIKSNDISVVSDDLFLFNCKDKPPLLLVFDEKRRPYLFLFKADIKPFIKKVGIPAS